MAGDRERLALLAALAREGRAFYTRASRLASDPRAKDLFLRLAGEKADQLRLLREARSAPGSRARRPRVARSEVYPRAPFDPLVCYICGVEVKGREIPQECPQCGASAYAFEVDMDEASALALAIASERRHLEAALAARAAARGRGARELLARYAELEAGSLGSLEARRRGALGGGRPRSLGKRLSRGHD